MWWLLRQLVCPLVDLKMAAGAERGGANRAISCGRSIV